MDNKDLLLAAIGGTLLFILLIAGMTLLVLAYNARERRRNKEAIQATIDESERLLYGVAVELHDSVAQDLNLLRINLLALAGSSPDLAKHALHESCRILAKTNEQIRSLSRSLNADYLMDRRLVPAMREKVKYINSAGGIKAQLHITGEATVLPATLELFIYRIGQEAIGNAIVHSKAAHLVIKLSFELNDFRMIISDDGCGFDTTKKKPSAGMGLRSMERRAAHIQGQLELVSVPDKGTQVSLFLPNIRTTAMPGEEDITTLDGFWQHSSVQAN